MLTGYCFTIKFVLDRFTNYATVYTSEKLLSNSISEVNLIFNSWFERRILRLKPIHHFCCLFTFKNFPDNTVVRVATNTGCRASKKTRQIIKLLAHFTSTSGVRQANVFRFAERVVSLSVATDGALLRNYYARFLLANLARFYAF